MKITSDHFLLCIFLSLLRGVTGTSPAPGTSMEANPTATLTTTTTTTTPTTTTPTTPTTTPTTTAAAPPDNVNGVTVSARNESSITLTWNKVNDIPTYLLQIYNENGPLLKEDTMDEEAGSSVTHVVTPLIAGRKYNFTLITTSEGLSSTGHKFQAVTAPRNAEEFKSVDQNETSITLQWRKVDDILVYKLNETEITFDASVGQQMVHTISALTSKTEYSVTLYTVYGNVSSTGVSITAYTAPPNAEGFKSIDQNETSITLQWKQVDGIHTYTLAYSAEEINVTASEGQEETSYTVPGLTSGARYNFTLYSLFGNVRSSGQPLSAVTAPERVKKVEVLKQSESSITLKWDKVKDISTYFLQYDNREDDINEPHGASVTREVSLPTAGRKYDFILITAFESVNSTEFRFEAVTAPRNTERFTSVDQDETSITLQWKQVDGIHTYTLAYSAEEINVTASEGQEETSYTVPGLTSGARYNFTLYSLFGNVRSSGQPLSAVTAPEPVKKVEVLKQSESSITLKWDKVKDISTYFLQYDNREDDINEPHGASVTREVSLPTAGRKYDFILITAFESVNSTEFRFEAVTAPRNTERFTSVDQDETSITLQWKQVDGIHNYTLVFNGQEINVPPLVGEENATHTVSDLTSTTEYSFTLYSVFDNVSSSGVNTTAYTAPPNAGNFKSIGQNETSITLQWRKVEKILNYILVFNGGDIDVPALAGQEQVSHTIPGLQSGTKYDFTLYCLFGGVRSSGEHLTAVTAPRNTNEFKAIDQNETSITLQWEKVDNILNYTLVFNGSEINVYQVTHTIPRLTSGTKYEFSLFTVFESVKSSGVNLTAVTAPRNTDEFKAIDQNETSITLQWEKVDNILNYTLVFNGNEINVSATVRLEKVTHTILALTSGTKYNFSLFTVFENVKSSGVNHTAVTAPRNTNEFKAIDQNETSITLQWEKVDNILNYTLVFNGSEINVYQVTHTIPRLTSGTKYEFSLFTVFESVKSRGVNLTAVTAPRNTDEFKAIDQNETSITLQWEKVDNILNYTLVFNGSEINVYQVTHTIPRLTSGTKYEFSLFTVFESVKSSGVNLTAVTAPGNVNNVTVLSQNESSITLTWDKVNNISTYFLQYDNNGSPVNVEAFYPEGSVTYEVSPLNAGTKYYFTLTTQFEKVNSTGFSFNAVTVPRAVTLVNVTECSKTSITLTWLNVNKEWDYFLQIEEGNLQNHPDGDTGVVSRSVTSLRPGTEYQFSVFTMFSGHNSTAYKGFAVTAVDCTSVAWRVTTSSIQGRVEGLFSNATATNGSQTHVSRGDDKNVSFSGLYPGATYEVSLVYETGFTCIPRCSHSLTITPQDIQSAHCENYADGYSVSIVWDKPEGVSTSVVVNVKGKTEVIVHEGDGQKLILPGFQPAKTYEVSLTSRSGDVRSDKSLVFLCPTDPRGVIAGAVCGVLLFALLVCLAIFIFLKRPDIISRQKPFIGGAKQSNKKLKSVSVAKFPNHFHHLSVDENRGFSQEYESLSPVGTEQTRKTAMLPENKPRNRFNNVQPYDWCRVKLSTSNSSGTSDYINASYMPGYNGNREFIASQGPLPSTVDDFWRMIWEQRVKGIVMVTNCTEGGKTKCERYWPADGKPCTYGELLVTNRSEQQESNWTLREFTAKNRMNSEERTVTHFHFTAWPDHGVPQGTEVLIQFRALVRRHMEREGATTPIVVHCSAGVGRTGTFIALDTLLQQLERDKAVGINGFVYKMRLNRPYMVQTESQYVFLHQCIMDSLQQNEQKEENIYENEEMIYANATALREFHTNA